jgi:hypothetical protein
VESLSPLDSLSPLESLSTDSIEIQLEALERFIARSRARQMVLLREIDRRQIPMVDGCRTLAEWAGSRLDLSPETAATLATVTLAESKPIHLAVETGDITFDRAAELTRLDSADPVAETAGMSIPRLRHHIAGRRRLSKAVERTRHAERFLLIQPSLDQTALRLWGELVDIDAERFHQIILEAADATPTLPCGRREPSKARMADALVNLVIDSTGGDAPAITTMVTVLVDARDAAPTNGESGVHTLSGHRLGPAALEAILCDAIVEVNAIASDGRLLGVGRKTRTLPGRLRRLIHQRDRICTADGCLSTHRLQPHHIVHRVEGGPDDPSNLTLLCWFHHHVVIHRRGHRIDPSSAPGRIRFLPPEPGTDPPI